MLSTKDFECQVLFEEDGANRNGLKQPETVALKRRADKQETEDFYLNVRFLCHFLLLEYVICFLENIFMHICDELMSSVVVIKKPDGIY